MQPPSPHDSDCSRNRILRQRFLLREISIESVFHASVVYNAIQLVKI
jgi:hypothetical protein